MAVIDRAREVAIAIDDTHDLEILTGVKTLEQILTLLAPVSVINIDRQMLKIGYPGKQAYHSSGCPEALKILGKFPRREGQRRNQASPQDVSKRRRPNRSGSESALGKNQGTAEGCSKCKGSEARQTNDVGIGQKEDCSRAAG